VDNHWATKINVLLDRELNHWYTRSSKPRAGWGPGSNQSSEPYLVSWQCLAGARPASSQKSCYRLCIILIFNTFLKPRSLLFFEVTHNQGEASIISSLPVFFFIVFYGLACLMNSKARGLSIGLLSILHKNIHWVWCCIVQSEFVQMCPMWPLKISRLCTLSFSGKSVAARLNPVF